ncbi:MAG: hypothetical protein LBT97_07540 [Planctomycetota bacterium]|jgi:hypothetical protein|nr:hypothetical protein [Planctomycetota bacterium]
MLRPSRRAAFFALGALLIPVVAGCGNPIKRESANVFPGTPAYDKRVGNFKITPEQAYRIAREAGQTDRQLQHVSRRPTAIVKRWYVFSIPQASGAQLQGYHVNGDDGTVKFHREKKYIPPGRG